MSLLSTITRKFNTFKTNTYNTYSANPATMLLVTGTLGWALSAAGQIAAVLFNDKISLKEKAFLIPQELGDATINILSFYLLTRTATNIAENMARQGKITTPKIKDFLKSKGLLGKKMGKEVLDIDSFPPDMKKAVEDLRKDAGVVAGIAGAIVSTNIITPILRNKYAAHCQKITMAELNEKRRAAILQQKIDETPVYRRPNVQPARGISMDNYINQSAMKYSGNLKI